jgi:ribonuclease HI
MKPRPPCEVYIDGASRGNPGPAGIGAVFLNGEGGAIHRLSRYLGETTNNVAEYLALLYALQAALREGYQDLTVKSDSELLVRQLSGAYRVRDATLRLLHDLARELMAAFRRCTVQHIPRAQNAEADRLANAALDGPRDPGVRPAPGARLL